MNHQWAGRLGFLFTLLLVLGVIVRTSHHIVWGVDVSPALLAFPAAYAVLSIYTSIYGYARARRWIWMSSAAVLLTTLIVLLDTILTAAAQGPTAKALIAYDIRRTLLVFVLALLVGQFVTAAGTSRLKVWMQSRYPLVRFLAMPFLGMMSTLASFLAGFIDTPIGSATTIAVVIGKFAVFYAVLLTAYAPAIWLLYRRVQAHDQDVLDTDVSLNPFDF